MEFKEDRRYHFCEKHRHVVNTDIGWVRLEEADKETCDYVAKKKRCGEDAYLEFYGYQVLE